MEFRPFFWILAPPDHSIVVFQNQFVATFLRRIGLRRFYIRRFFICFYQMLDEEILYNDFLTTPEYQDEVISPPLITRDIFRSQLQNYYRRAIQNNFTALPDISTGAIRLVDYLGIREDLGDTTF